MTLATDRLQVAILGASGYTGIEALRLLVDHPKVQISALTAERNAGQPARAVFASLAPVALPDLVRIEDLDLSRIDLVIACLPHGTTQDVVSQLPAGMPVIDLSADFRLRDPGVYEAWYGRAHSALALQADAAYGLSEFNRAAIRSARITACPGCYPTCVLLALLPLVRAGVIDADAILIDAKSGVSGGGRGLKQGMLFAEAGERVSAYGLGSHRHMAEMEQELEAAVGREIRVSFTPHLIPMSRGMLATCHLQGEAEAVHATLCDAYADEPFVHVLPAGEAADTGAIRGTNHCLLSVHADRVPGRVIVLSAIDNLTKGSSGQAVQNLNLRQGWDERLGLPTVALFP